MNGAPDWQDGECCFRCRTQFTLVARKHHCRNCGNILCAKCSSQQIAIPKLNIEKPVRVCDGCYEKLSKAEETLVLASVKDAEPDQAKSKSISRHNASTTPKSSSNSNKPSANASAPSEQELKEEEELQLALALSLSEAPTRVSFPDCRQLEGSSNPSTPTTLRSSTKISQSAKTSDSVSHQISSLSTGQLGAAGESSSSTNHPPQQYVSPVRAQPATTTTVAPDVLAQNQQLLSSTQVVYPQDFVALDRDQELFRFVAEVQSTAEVFTNRINSNKLRNRPITDDSAIQSLFLRLTNMHTKLLEYIKTHEEERAGHEAIQDKLSQISDARAALDALREEHQEKIRQEAAEAERQRQSQLASKLEMMRQKKSQMMQYQREIALQRIQAQEMMLRRPPTGGYPQQVPTALQQPTPSQQPSVAVPQPVSVHQIPTTVPQTPVMSQQSISIPTMQISTTPGVVQEHQQMLQQPQHSITEDEAPLISFDD